MKGADFEFDYSESISSDYSEVSYKIGVDVNIPELTFRMTPKAGEQILSAPPKMDLGYQLLYNLLSCGDYSRAILTDFAGKTFDGKEMTFDCTVKAKFYMEVSMKLEQAANGKLAYVSGGYQTPMVFIEAFHKDTVPFSKLYSDVDADIKTKINGISAEFETDLNNKIDMDIERYYVDKVSEVKKGSYYVDNVKDCKMILSECSKYNGNRNGQFLDFDFSNQYRNFMDGRLMEIFNWNLYEADAGIMKANYIYLSDIIPASRDVSQNGDVDPRHEEKAKQLIAQVDPDADYTYEFSECQKHAERICDSVSGKSNGDNTMLIVGIVIAILIIAALVALWYFKFR